MKIILASDHVGFNLKKLIQKHLKSQGFTTEDIGSDNIFRSNYASYGLKLGKTIHEGKAQIGIAVCGSGIGISIAANRFTRVRAARVFNVEDAKLTRKHNNANVIAIGARYIKRAEAIKMVDAFISESFDGGRHTERVETLDKC